MLYNLILNFVDQYTFLNVFKYLTFRTGLAMFTSMIIVLLIGTPFINFFSAKKILDPIREDGPNEHILKKVLGKSISLSEEGWKSLTIRWMFFFFALALLNEYIWRTQTEEFWVNFKVWGILPVTFVFTIFQMFLINKHKI